jgi:hypothetical protein
MIMKMSFTEDDVKQILINTAQRYVNCHTAGAWTACGGLHCDLRAIDEVVLDIEEIEHTYRIPVCVRHYYECITMSTPKLLQDIRAGKLNGLWRDKQGNVMENNELLNKI